MFEKLGLDKPVDGKLGTACESHLYSNICVVTDLLTSYAMVRDSQTSHRLANCFRARSTKKTSQ